MDPRGDRKKRKRYAGVESSDPSTGQDGRGKIPTVKKGVSGKEEEEVREGKDLPKLLNSTRSRPVTLESYVAPPSLRNVVYECVEFPGGVFIDKYGKIQPDHLRPGKSTSKTPPRSQARRDAHTAPPAQAPSDRFLHPFAIQRIRNMQSSRLIDAAQDHLDTWMSGSNSLRSKFKVKCDSDVHSSTPFVTFLIIKKVDRQVFELGMDCQTYALIYQNQEFPSIRKLCLHLCTKTSNSELNVERGGNVDGVESPY